MVEDDGGGRGGEAADADLRSAVHDLLARHRDHLGAGLSTDTVVDTVVGSSGAEIPAALLREGGEAAGVEGANIRSVIGSLPIPEKMRVALFGNLVCRGLLIRDPNKLIQMCVLKNPKVTLGEIEEFARNPNLSEGVLRAIAENREWMGSYAVKRGIVTNPKTPGDLGLKWVRFLNVSDLRALASSREVSALVAQAARKRLAEAQKR